MERRASTEYATAPEFHCAGVVQPLAQQWRLGLIINQLGVQQSITRQDLRTQQQNVANDAPSSWPITSSGARLSIYGTPIAC
jgi:hypothetical protein